MRTLFLLSVCALSLSACGDTYQAAPVDEVSAASLPPPIPNSHHRSDQ